MEVCKGKVVLGSPNAGQPPVRRARACASLVAEVGIEFLRHLPISRIIENTSHPSCWSISLIIDASFRELSALIVAEM